MQNLKKKTFNKGFRRAEYIFVALMLALPLFYHILNTYILGFYNIFFTFQNYDGNGQLQWVGVENFKTAWDLIFSGESSLLLLGLKNGLLVWGLSNVVMFPITMIFSLYIAKGYKGNKVFRFASMIPTMVTGLILSQIFIKVMEGPVPSLISNITGNDFIYFFNDPRYTKGTLIGFTLWSGFGSCLIIYPNAMNAIDKSIVEASQIDGAGDLLQLWHVYLPGMWPTITVMYFSAFGGLLTSDLPNFLFYGYSAPQETYTLGYYIFKETMQGGDNMGPVLNAINYMIALISVPLTMLWKYLAENYGPSEDETHIKKKRLINVNENR